MVSAIDIFCCYARKDKALLDELKTHMSPLQRQRLVRLWSDGDINAGDTWEEEIHHRLQSAQIILMLISPDFIASDYCYDIEMHRALERQERGDAYVIPIILRHTEWQETPFGKLQALPTDGKPINSKAWTDRDEAFNTIVVGIRKAVKTFISMQWVENGVKHVQAERYDEALAAFEEAIQNDPSLMMPYGKKGDVLSQQNRYEEAIVAYEQAPNRDTAMFMKQGKALLRLRRYEEALVAYETSIRLNNSEALAHAYKGYTLFQLGRDEEGLLACTQALQRDKECALASYFSCSILAKLQRSQEAATAYQQAILVTPTDGESLHVQGDALSALKRYSEALSVYEQALTLAPKDPSIYQSQGATFFEISEYKEALNAYEQALGLNPKDATMYFYKGQALEQLAKQAYNEAKRYSYTGDQEEDAFFPSSKAFSPQKLKLLHTLEHPSKPFSSFALCPDGLILASTDGKEEVQVWDIPTGKSLRTFTAKNYLSLHPYVITETSCVFSSDGYILILGLYCTSPDHESIGDTYIFLFNPLEDEPLKIENNQGRRFFDFVSCAINYNSTYYINAFYGIGYEINLKMLHTGIDPFDTVLSTAISLDTLIILVGCNNNTIEIWNQNKTPDVRNRKNSNPFIRTHFITGHAGPIRSLAISPDQQTFVSGSEDTTIKIWHLHTGKILRTLNGHTGSVQAVVISPNGRVLVSGSQDRTIKMWDMHTGELLRTIDEHTEGIKRLAFSEDGRILVSGDGKAIKIWEQQ